MHCIQFMKHHLRTYLLSLLTLLAVKALGQETGQLSGYVSDQTSGEALVEARITLLSPLDSTVVAGALSNDSGYYQLRGITVGNYVLKVTYFGYKDLFRTVQLSTTQSALNLALEQEAIAIEGVEVQARAIRVEQNGDTTQYNADAFKTNPDATVQDLVTKMPGITVENGVVKAHGEEITKVTVDGQEFFGDDVSAALKNLPAEIVSKIQVYDQASDQAKFTGISDGNEAKALNIITKPNKNQGQFGKIYAGYGYPNNLYMAGSNVNFFKNTRRISIVGMSNNVNQQNFSTDDILGVTGSSGNSNRRRPPCPGGPAENYLVSQQNGVSTTHAFGVNYSDLWGKNTKVTGSYFFNASETNNSQLTSRNYVLSTTAGQKYNEDFSAKMNNSNHRINFRFDITLDTLNSLVISPKLSYQGNDKTQNTAGPRLTVTGRLSTRLTTVLLAIITG